MGLSIPSVPTTIAALTAEEVWDYATKNLTNPAAAQDLANMLPGISPTATGRAARLDLITAARLAELDPANIPADIDTLLAALTVHAADLGIHDVDVKALLQHATYGLSKLSRTSMLEVMEHEIEFPSAEALDDIAAAGDQTTTERTITVALPALSAIRRVMLLAVTTIMNDTATAHKIDVTVQGRKGAGAWNNYFDEDDCVGFGAVDGATTSLITLQDVTALVNEAATYGFRLTVNQSGGANSVHYTTQYLLVITYRMS